MNLSKIRKFEDKTVNPGERYVFSAGFDVKRDLKNTERIDQEIADIKRISDSGGIVAILSHQGRLEYNDVIHLDYVANYLSGKLERKVEYYPENDTYSAEECAGNLKPGSIAIFGNTRFHKEEIENDIELAKRFSELGDYVVIGGFCKAHRKHSSNNGILNYRPGFLASSCIEQIKLLEPWEGRKIGYSIAILGGIKKEKIKALKGFAEIYDFIIPGGIALNTILKVKGYEIGDSLIEDSGKTFEKEIEEILKKHEEKIYIPQLLMISKKTEQGFKESNWISCQEGVPEGYSIVDFKLQDGALNELERVVKEQGRILLAGTPGIYTAGFNTATNQVLKYLNNPRVNSIILGGDSANEIPFSGTKSSGGGSALEYLCTGTLAICEALKENKKRFPHLVN
ncbi:MAG: phosphoglycerate kinase [Nanoarchaeota archaeon]